MDTVSIRLSPGLQLRLWHQFCRAKPILGEDAHFSAFLRDCLILAVQKLEATENPEPRTFHESFSR